MNRFWKAVLCAVVLSSFVGCGSDDDDDGGGAGPVAGNNNNTSVVVVPKDFCAEYPTHSECQPKKEYVFKGIESQIGIENFEEEPDLKTWLFGTTGLYGAKYVIEKVATANQTYQFLNQLIVDKKFNKNYLDQWLNWIAWGGVQISNWLELIGLNTELRR
ncbi:MAG: hypothetical protein LBQ18_06240, partial [Campylobacteraceae bacterium]|nr:hypothetical protein [Campylobacteraceae bacterium]